MCGHRVARTVFALAESILNNRFAENRSDKFGPPGWKQGNIRLDVNVCRNHGLFQLGQLLARSTIGCRLFWAFSWETRVRYAAEVPAGQVAGSATKAAANLN